MNRIAISSSLSLACLLALGGLAEADGNGQAPAAKTEARTVKSGSCSGLTEVFYKADDDFNSTTSSGDFVDVPGTSISFTQGGSVSGCAIVTFSAESYAEFGRLLLVRARIDDASTAAPGAIQFSGDDDEDEDGRWARAHSFTFIFPSVAPGNHTVTMQYRSLRYGRAVHLGKHTTVVQHR
jgi:hypothetical protein